MWGDFLKNTVLKPLFERLGTVGAALLLFGGEWVCKTFDACGLVTPAGANMVMTYIMAVALVVVELALSWANRRAAVRKAADEASRAAYVQGVERGLSGD